ncbi:MAG: hypothetical protein KJO07_00545 [Deltaproteobacteria bacterium]|nr:hypothetical protein [Deltaproteobacteria bacterium]
MSLALYAVFVPIQEWQAVSPIRLRGPQQFVIACPIAAAIGAILLAVGVFQRLRA